MPSGRPQSKRPQSLTLPFPLGGWPAAGVPKPLPQALFPAPTAGPATLTENRRGLTIESHAVPGWDASRPCCWASVLTGPAPCLPRDTPSPPGRALQIHPVRNQISCVSSPYSPQGRVSERRRLMKFVFIKKSQDSVRSCELSFTVSLC